MSDKLHHIVINQRVVQFWNDDKEPWYSYTLWFKPTKPVSTKVRPTKIKEYGVEILTDVPEDPRLVTYNVQTGLYSRPCVGALPEPPYSWEPFATDPGDPEEIRKEIKRALSEYVHTP
jgi:hypothetical protein